MAFPFLAMLGGAGGGATAAQTGGAAAAASQSGGGGGGILDLFGFNFVKQKSDEQQAKYQASSDQIDALIRSSLNNPMQSPIGLQGLSPNAGMAPPINPATGAGSGAEDGGFLKFIEGLMEDEKPDAKPEIEAGTGNQAVADTQTKARKEKRATERDTQPESVVNYFDELMKLIGGGGNGSNMAQ